MLLFTESSSSSALDASGGGGVWQGIFFAPNGRALVQGSNNLSVSGAIIADEVHTSGSDWSLDAEDYVGGDPAFKLVE